MVDLGGLVMRSRLHMVSDISEGLYAEAAALLGRPESFDAVYALSIRNEATT